jgi:CHC2 zinc finger
MGPRGGGMVMRAPAPLLASDVKARADFAAIASHYTKLRKSGRQCVGLCPLHSERHASFYVHTEKQIFYCFGCGAGGDVFDFIMRVEGCDFLDALQMVASWGSPRERAREARECFRAGGGAKPLAPRSGAVFIARKCEANPHPIPALVQWPSLECAAERAIEAERERGSFTCQKPDNRS